MAGHVLERSTVKDVADVMMGYPSRTFTKVGARWRVSSAVERRELRWARYGAVSGRRALDALAAGATRVDAARGFVAAVGAAAAARGRGAAARSGASPGVLAGGGEMCSAFAQYCDAYVRDVEGLAADWRDRPGATLVAFEAAWAPTLRRGAAVRDLVRRAARYDGDALDLDATAPRALEALHYAAAARGVGGAPDAAGACRAFREVAEPYVRAVDGALRGGAEPVRPPAFLAAAVARLREKARAGGRRPTLRVAPWGGAAPADDAFFFEPHEAPRPPARVPFKPTFDDGDGDDDDLKYEPVERDAHDNPYARELGLMVRKLCRGERLPEWEDDAPEPLDVAPPPKLPAPPLAALPRVLRAFDAAARAYDGADAPFDGAAAAARLCARHDATFSGRDGARDDGAPARRVGGHLERGDEAPAVETAAHFAAAARRSAARAAAFLAGRRQSGAARRCAAGLAIDVRAAAAAHVARALEKHVATDLGAARLDLRAALSGAVDEDDAAARRRAYVFDEDRPSLATAALLNEPLRSGVGAPLERALEDADRFFDGDVAAFPPFKAAVTRAVANLAAALDSDPRSPSLRGLLADLDWDGRFFVEEPPRLS